MRLVIKLLAIAIIGGALLAVGGYFLVPPAAQTALAEGSRFAFGVPSNLGGIGASPGLSTTSIGFTDYELESPEGFEDPVLSIGKFNLGVGTSSLLGDTKEVGSFVLEDLVLTLEQDGVNTNIIPILRHLDGLTSAGDGATGSDETEDAPAGSEEGSPGPRLKVGKIEIKGLAARLKLSGVPGLEAFDETFAVPDYIEDFSSITGEDGLTVAELAGALVGSLKDKAMSAADGKVPADLLTALEATLDGGLEGGLGGAVDAAKGLAAEKVDELKGEAQKAVDDGKSTLQDAASKALEGSTDDAKKTLKKGLGGLLGGKDGGR